MKYIYIILTTIFFISCQEKNSTDKIDIFSVPEKKIVQKEEIKLDSIIFPTEIYPFKQWIVGINLPNYSKNIFDFINKETLNKDFSCIKFGNGANEYSDCNPYFFQSEEDDKIVINVNNHHIKTLQFKANNLSQINSTEINSTEVINDLIKKDKNTFIFKSSSINPYYEVYDINSKTVISSFGDYPSVKLSDMENEEEDYANFFREKSVFDSKNNQFFSFYTNIPLIRVYKDYKLVKEIWTKDDFKTNVSDFYDEKTKIFYLTPYIRQEKIYVVYVNKDKDDFSKNVTSNLLVWNLKGELVKRYTIDKPFQTYTISEDGTQFYAIDNSNPDYTVIFKGKL